MGLLFPIYGKINIMFQTTNQPLIFHYQRVFFIIQSPGKYPHETTKQMAQMLQSTNQQYVVYLHQTM